MLRTRNLRESAFFAMAAALLALAGPAAAQQASGASAAADGRPNILLIVADDAGYTDLGSFGGEIHTPNLDALAAVGVRFTQFTASATCSPSRSMLMTGVDNHQAGLGAMAEFTAPNQVGQPGYEGHLNDRVVTVSTLLAEAGYDTFMAGKWHLGEEREHWPAARGFVRDLSLIPGGGSHLEDMWGAVGERQLYTYNGEPIRALRPGFHSSVDYTAAIIENIEEHRGGDRPFFAYLALQAPHDPLQPPADWRDRYAGRYDVGYDAVRAARIARMKTLGLLAPDATVFPRLPSVPAWEALTDEEKRRSARAMELYAAMVGHMDENIGKLIGYLKATGLYENTLIFFMSDNGAEGNMLPIGAPWDNSRFEDWGTAGSFIHIGPAWAQVGAGPLSLFKGFPTEGGVRVPMIVAGTGVEGAARISDAVTHVTDIPATILEAAGAAYPDRADIAPLAGRSLAPILTGAEDAVRGPDDAIGFELFGNRALRMGDWKAVWLCAPFGPGAWQLFDLKADPGETADLAAAQPDVLARLMARWDDYAAANNVIPASVSPVCRP